jgi:hypothetical protein
VACGRWIYVHEPNRIEAVQVVSVPSVIFIERKPRAVWREGMAFVDVVPQFFRREQSRHCQRIGHMWAW